MAVTTERALFWYGCNLTRHAEIIRTAARLMEAVGVDTAVAGGPGHCCGNPKEASARINEGMAKRTVEGFNATGRDTVVSWCPSCHMNMQDSMAPVTPARFDTVHLSEVLHARRAALQKLLVHAVPGRMMLHAHLGFDPRVPVNRLVADILGLVPGLVLVETGLRVPSHTCGGLGVVKNALAVSQQATLAAMRESGADTLVTVFHSCHRDSVPLERHGIRVMNWMHVLAASAGWDAEDGYKALRNADDPRAAVDPAALARVGEVAFERLIEPELRRAPVV